MTDSGNNAARATFCGMGSKPSVATAAGEPLAVELLRLELCGCGRVGKCQTCTYQFRWFLPVKGGFFIMAMHRISE